MKQAEAKKYFEEVGIEAIKGYVSLMYNCGEAYRNWFDVYAVEWLAEKGWMIDMPTKQWKCTNSIEHEIKNFLVKLFKTVFMREVEYTEEIESYFEIIGNFISPNRDYIYHAIRNQYPDLRWRSVDELPKNWKNIDNLAFIIDNLLFLKAEKKLK